MPTDTTKPAGGAERTPAPPITMADLQEGDAVTISATVLKTQDGGYVVLQLRGFQQAGFSCFQFPVSELVTHTPKPKPLAPGDTVRFHNGAHTGLIVATKDDVAWVEWAVELRPYTTTKLDLLVMAAATLYAYECSANAVTDSAADGACLQGENTFRRTFTAFREHKA